MKNLKENKRKKIRITNPDRFWSLMVILLGILSVFIFKSVNEMDMTGPVFVIFLGTLGYIGTFGEDE